MIVDRYLAREIGYTLLAVFGLLMMILVSHQFVRYLADAAAGEVPGEMLLILIGLKSIGFASLVLPLALFLSVIVGLGRMYRDNEIVVLSACGIGPNQLLKSVLRVAGFVGLVLAILSLYLSPWASEKRSQILDQARAKPELTGIVPGRFQESNRGDIVYFVEKIEPGAVLKNLFIQYRTPSVKGILSAAQGSLESNSETGDRLLVLLDGHRYEESRDEFRAMDYEKHGVVIPSPKVEAIGRRREAIPSAQLSKTREDQAEWQWRLSLPISAVLLAALGVPLSHSAPREGRYGKLFTGILSYLLFSNLLSVARNWMERGITPVEFGLWWVHVLLFGLVVGMTMGADWWRALRARFQQH